MAAKNNNQPERRINGEIRGVRNVRLIGLDDDERNGVVTIEQATLLANELGLDLVEINRNAMPPICRICDYGKFLYEEKKNSKKQHSAPLKEIQLTANISEHDLETKVRMGMKFIEAGSKVKVVLKLFGRQLGRRGDSKVSLYQFIERMSDVAKPESLPKDEGKNTIVILKKK